MPAPIITSNPIRVTAGTIIDPTGELALYAKQGSNVVSNAIIDLAATTGFFLNITGTTPILAFGTADAGVIRLLIFTGSLTLTHNSGSLILPSGANIVTQPGDAAFVISLGAGNWKCLAFFRISGKAVSITAADIGLGNVENTALSTWIGSANVTTLGTIISGIWHGSAVTELYGGTGLSSYAQGDTIYAQASNDLVALAKDTNATRYYANTGTNNNPKWDQVNLTNGVTGVLPTANGGSGHGVQTPTAPTGTTCTIDLSLGNIIKLSLASASGNVTLTLQNPVAGLLYFMEVTQGVSARTLTFPTGTKQALTVGNVWTSTGASKLDVIPIYYNGSNYVIVGTVPDIA